MDLDNLRLVALAREQLSDGTARTLRQQHGLSLRDVADVVKVSPSAVSRWEQGERVPRTAAAVAYGRLLTELSTLTPASA